MKNLPKFAFGLGFIFAALLFVEFYSEAKEDSVKVRNATSSGVIKRIKSLPPAGQSDVYCAILIMPKTFLPVLKQISQHKIAQNIKILPANMDWSQGNLIVKPIETIWKDSTPRTDQTKYVLNAAKTASLKPPIELKRKIYAATFLAFLAGQPKSKIWKRLAWLKD